MPTYVYECPTCGERFERQQSFKDKPLETCPEGHAGVRRVFTPPGIVFKGSGWYITDSRNGSGASGNGAKATPKTEAKSESTGGAKAETKSEATSTAKSES
ncbi:MAG TPA: FmdB family transcriptional regulator [Chloroflexi bacterium]|nr:FmdB family transcriptional regulator [Chloroflexota bacterium]